MNRISFQGSNWQAVIDSRKWQTRRVGSGWHDRLVSRLPQTVLVVNKVMGLKKGERQTKLGLIMVHRVMLEKLSDISTEDTIAEGVDWAKTPAEFVEQYAKKFRCKKDAIVTAIEFELCETY